MLIFENNNHCLSGVSLFGKQKQVRKFYADMPRRKPELWLRIVKYSQQFSSLYKLPNYISYMIKYCTIEDKQCNVCDFRSSFLHIWFFVNFQPWNSRQLPRRAFEGLGSKLKMNIKITFLRINSISFVAGIKYFE